MNGSRASCATIAPGATMLSTQRFAGGLSSQMTVVAVEDPDGTRRRFVVRTRRPPHYGLSIASEYALLVALHDLGLRVPVPRHLDESMTLLDDPYLVLDYVDAPPRSPPTTRSPIARAFAAELAAIHRIDGTRAAFADLPRRTERIAEHLVDPPVELDASLGKPTSARRCARTGLRRRRRTYRCSTATSGPATSSGSATRSSR